MRNIPWLLSLGLNPIKSELIIQKRALFLSPSQTKEARLSNIKKKTCRNAQFHFSVSLWDYSTQKKSNIKLQLSMLRGLLIISIWHQTKEQIQELRPTQALNSLESLLHMSNFSQ